MHSRACKHCGQVYESESSAMAELARDYHENTCVRKEG